jgi:hypothetical protein
MATTAEKVRKVSAGADPPTGLQPRQGRVVCGAKRIRSRLAAAEVRISNLEIRNQFKARIANVQNFHALVSVIRISILFRASDFEFRIFLSLDLSLLDSSPRKLSVPCHRSPQRRGGLRRKAHPEPLPSFADRKAPRAFHHKPAVRPGLPLHYQWRDYAPLQSRPPCRPRPIDHG